MAEMTTLTEDLYDRRDPNRPPVFIAAKGAQVPTKVAELLGVKPATKARKEAEVEDKAVKPAAAKARSTKKD